MLVNLDFFKVDWKTQRQHLAFCNQNEKYSSRMWHIFYNRFLLISQLEYTFLFSTPKCTKIASHIGFENGYLQKWYNFVHLAEYKCSESEKLSRMYRLSLKADTRIIPSKIHLQNSQSWIVPKTLTLLALKIAVCISFNIRHETLSLIFTRFSEYGKLSKIWPVFWSTKFRVRRAS